MAYRLSQDEIKVTSILGRKLSTPTLDVLHPSHFAYRHIGPRRADVEEMLDLLGYPSLESFIDAVVPEEIRLRRPLALPPGRRRTPSRTPRPFPRRLPGCRGGRS